MKKTQAELDKQLIDNIFKAIPKIEPSRAELIIMEIESYRNTLKLELYGYPFIFFKARWERNAQLRSVESILVVAKRIYNRHNGE